MRVGLGQGSGTACAALRGWSGCLMWPPVGRWCAPAMPFCHWRGAELQRQVPIEYARSSRSCRAGEGARMSVQALRPGLWASTWARNRLPGARMRAARLQTSAPAARRARPLWRRLWERRRKWTLLCQKALWWRWSSLSPMRRRRQRLREARLRTGAPAACRARPLWRRMRARRRKWTSSCPRARRWQWWWPSPMRRRRRTRSLGSCRTMPRTRRPLPLRGCGLCVRAKRPPPMCTRPSCLPWARVPVAHSLGVLAGAGPGSTTACLTHVHLCSCRVGTYIRRSCCLRNLQPCAVGRPRMMAAVCGRG